MSTTEPSSVSLPTLAEPRMPEPAADVQDGYSTVTQNTLLPDVKALLLETADGPAWIPTPDGAVVISQTCDIAQATRHSVQVSPLRRLTGTLAKEAARENRPQYAPVWTADANFDSEPIGYADLEVVATWSKDRLARERQVPASWHTSRHTRRFGRAVGRRFSRFAWPDNIQPWVQPLLGVLQQRYNPETQAAGRLVADLQQVRVGANDWDQPHAELTLHFIFNTGVLPPLDTPEPVSVEVAAFLERGPGWKQIAERLERTDDAGDRLALYQTAADQWAAQCQPRGANSEEVRDAVSEVTAEIWGADTFTLDLAANCPNFDVDYVSAPVPGDTGS